ncbi:MAG: lytic murein transglycosylase [Solirubrobacterales bacterium]
MIGRARKIRTATTAAAATVALALPVAVARAETVESPAATPATPLEQPGDSDGEGGSLQHGATLTPPDGAGRDEAEPNGGVSADDAGGRKAKETEGKAKAGKGEADGGALAKPATEAANLLVVPSLPASSCAAAGVPPILIPIYRRAASKYELGPQGPAILAAINQIETGFGTNLGPSYAGAVGWMQFMPATWETYGVDANGDGVEDPNNPEDAIFAAAGYLAAAGMPGNTYEAIFAYNHADWYVEDVLAAAGCYAYEVGAPGTDLTIPRIQVFKCSPAKPWREKIPHTYLRAFEDAAARYELGQRGVWALAAVARLESDFGRGLNKKQLRETGALGLDGEEWAAYAVDGDGDGKIRRADPVDSAATLARLFWSRGDLQAGLFAHNQAEWYVQAVLTEADRLEGDCKVRYDEWALAPLRAGLETDGPTAVLNGNLASAPRNAPAAIKAVIAAANSITDTPYVWGGGHGAWYSYGYDCSGAVSFALYGGGLLGTPLVSGDLASYGEAGPGKWITIYANAAHTYVTIAGLRFDTAGNPEGVSGPRWHTTPPYPDGYVVRHPPGY